MKVVEGNVTERAPDLLRSAGDHLEAAKFAYMEGNWKLVVRCCMFYLEYVPIQPLHEVDDAETKTLSRKFAEGMINLNHDYDSVIQLISIKESMMAFAESFFLINGKKGVVLPPPEATEADATLLYNFCLSFRALVDERISG